MPTAEERIDRLFNQLQKQLNDLVEFLKLPHEQVPYAGFLLGYSYAEAFIAGLIKELYDVLAGHPAVGSLPPELGNMVSEMIDDILNSMNSLVKKIAHLRSRFGLKVQLTDAWRDADTARNAWIHNAGVVNRPQKRGARWQQGKFVDITVSYVHELGIAARKSAQDLCAEAKAKLASGLIENDRESAQLGVNVANAIMAIHPYKHNALWVFDDPGVGLRQEPFVSGADVIIDHLVENLREPEKGFTLLFSAQPFPGHQAVFEWRRKDRGGNWYFSPAHGLEGWLCPALFKYFDREQVPDRIYAQVKSKSG
jgi:hypothetical protein